MELGISGRWAIVCAASKGLGLACARALAKEGVNLVINARGNDILQPPPRNCAAWRPASKCARWPATSASQQCASRCWRPVRRWTS